MLIALGLLLATLWVYWPNINGGLCGDDEQVTSPWYIKSGSLRALRKSGALGVRAIPILIYTGLSRIKLASARTTHFHLTNILLHASTSIVCFKLLITLGLSQQAAALGALWFLAQPLAVSSVANIAGMANTLGGLLASLVLLSVATGYWWLALPLIAICAFVKQDLVLLPLMAGSMLMWQGHALGILFWLVPLVLYTMLRKSALLHQEALSKDHGWPDYLRGPAYVKTYMVESLLRFPKWFVGWGYSISPNVEETTWKTILRLKSLGPIVLLTGILTLCWYSPVAMLGLLLLVTSPWVGYLFRPMPDLIMEHRAYVSLLGMVIIATILSTLCPVWVTGLWIGCLASTARYRCRAWQTGRLNEQAIDDGTTKPMPLLNRSSELIAMGRLGEAQVMLNKACEGAPQAFHAYVNRLNIFALSGQRAAAVSMGISAHKVYPRVFMAFLVAGNTWENIGRPARALVVYRKGIRRYIAIHGGIDHENRLWQAYDVLLQRHFAPLVPPAQYVL